MSVLLTNLTKENKGKEVVDNQGKTRLEHELNQLKDPEFTQNHSGKTLVSSLIHWRDITRKLLGSFCRSVYLNVRKCSSHFSISEILHPKNVRRSKCKSENRNKL